MNKLPTTLLGTALMVGLAATASAATIAHFSFEEGTHGLAVNSVGSSGATGSLTVSGGGDGTNGMVAWSIAASPTYVTSTAPTPFANAIAMSFGTASGGGDDLYQPNAAASTLSTTNFVNFTIETYVNLYAYVGWQTFIGRDDNGNPGQGAGAASLFYLSTAGAPIGTGLTNGFRVELINASNTGVAVNSAFVPDLNTWYHVAAVGDATAGTLSLYVDGTLVGSTTGYNGMLPLSTPTSWTLGRGQYNGNPADTIRGMLDEVRFSDVALSPSQFLNATAIPEPSSFALLAGLGVLGLAGSRRRRAC